MNFKKLAALDSVFRDFIPKTPLIVSFTALIRIVRHADFKKRKYINSFSSIIAYNFLTAGVS